MKPTPMFLPVNGNNLLKLSLTSLKEPSFISRNMKRRAKVPKDDVFGTRVRTNAQTYERPLVRVV